MPPPTTKGSIWETPFMSCVYILWPAPPPAFAAAEEFDAPAARVIYRSIPCNGSFHQGIRLADSVRNLTFDQLLSIKTFHGNLCIRRHDNAVSLLDLLICKNVFGSAGASCLHLDKTVSGLCRFFKSFCRHIGVGNSGRTGGNCQDFYLCLICASRISQYSSSISFSHRQLCQ